ncbi:MAG: hypothetical protein K1W06_07405 [Lachnospiraceae bacterium]
MELMFEIEEAKTEAEALKSMMLAVTDAAYGGSYSFNDYEPAFHYLCILSHKLYEDLKKLTDEAFALKRAK